MLYFMKNRGVYPKCFQRASIILDSQSNIPRKYHIETFPSEKKIMKHELYLGNEIILKPNKIKIDEEVLRPYLQLNVLKYVLLLTIRTL